MLIARIHCPFLSPPLSTFCTGGLYAAGALNLIVSSCIDRQKVRLCILMLQQHLSPPPKLSIFGGLACSSTCLNPKWTRPSQLKALMPTTKCCFQKVSSKEPPFDWFLLKIPLSVEFYPLALVQHLDIRWRHNELLFSKSLF